MDAVEVTLANYGFQSEHQSNSSSQKGEGKDDGKRTGKLRMMDDSMDSIDSENETQSEEAVANVTTGKGTQIDLSV